MEYAQLEKRLLSFLIALSLGHESTRTKLDALKQEEGIIVIDMFQEVLIARGLAVATKAYEDSPSTYESNEFYLMLLELLTFLGYDPEIMAINYYISVKKEDKTVVQYMDTLDALLLGTNDEEAMAILNLAAIELSKRIFEDSTIEVQQRMMDLLDRI